MKSEIVTRMIKIVRFVEEEQVCRGMQKPQEDFGEWDSRTSEADIL